MSQQDMDRTAYLEARVGELHQKIGDLRGELERERASRRDWAAEAMRLQEKVNTLLGLLDCVHDGDPCRWDHNHSCQAHGFFYLRQGEKCPQHEIGELLAEAERGAVHPEADR